MPSSWKVVIALIQYGGLDLAHEGPRVIVIRRLLLAHVYLDGSADILVEFEPVDAVALDAPRAHDVADRHRMLVVDLVGRRQIQRIRHRIAGGQLVDVRLQPGAIRDVLLSCYVLSSRAVSLRGSMLLGLL